MQLPKIIRRFYESDQHMQDVLKGSTTAFTLKIFATALNFGYNALLARTLGADGLGIYFLALTIVTISSVIARLGLDNALLRFVALNAEAGNWAAVAGVYKLGMKTTVVSSVLFTIITYLFAPFFAQSFFLKPELASPLQLMALSIIPYSLLALYGEILKGIKEIKKSMIVNGLTVPVVSIPIFFLLEDDYNIMAAAIAYTAASFFALSLAHFFWVSSNPQVVKTKGEFGGKLLFKTSMPLFVVALLNLFTGWTDMVILGMWLDSKSVGIYGIVFRIAAITSFILFAVNSIIAPKFAALYSQRKMDELAGLARKSAKLMLVCTFPVIVVFMLFPGWILSFFGADFEEGAIALIILAFGQFVNVATGSVGYLLIMSGKQKVVQNATIFSALINILLLTLLVPKWGVVGAAIGSTVSMVLLNITLFVMVRCKLSIILFPSLEKMFKHTERLWIRC